MYDIGFAKYEVGGTKYNLRVFMAEIRRLNTSQSRNLYDSRSTIFTGDRPPSPHGEGNPSADGRGEEKKRAKKSRAGISPKPCSEKRNVISQVE